MNLASILEHATYHFPNRPALSEDAVEITYAQLNDRANRIATGLINIGIQPGDHICLFAPNSSDWIATYFGILKAGAVAMSIPAVSTREEAEIQINHAKPKIIFTSDEKLDALIGLRQSEYLEKVICPDGDMDIPYLMETGTAQFKATDRDAEDTAVILYTGGTTGIPKGVLLSHENVLTALQSVRFHERSTETDRALLYLPLNHTFGQMHIMGSTLLAGGCLEMLPTFEIEKVLDLMSKGRVTRFYGVPTLFVRLLSTPNFEKKLGRVDYCFSAAASIAEETVRQWEERTGLSVFEAYGMSESASMTTYNHYYRHVLGSVGTPVPGMDIQIRDKAGRKLSAYEYGEICLKGRNIMKGYLSNPCANEKAFWEGRWFRSGDIGYMDENNYIYIVDRLKDMIISGGQNVYPREIEELLYTQPAVQECTVIGLPDPLWGEKVTAYIISKPEKEINPEALKAFLKSKLSGYKVPKEYRSVGTLPKSSTGKILKKELRKAAAQS